jgi:hypothetical protein
MNGDFVTSFVYSLPTDADGIIGMDFLSEKNADLNLGECELRLLKGPNFAHSLGGQRTRQAKGKDDHRPSQYLPQKTTTIFSEERVARVRSGKGTQEQGCRQRPQDTHLQEVESWIVKTTETIKLAPRVKVTGKMELPKRRASPELVCVHNFH